MREDSEDKSPTFIKWLAGFGGTAITLTLGWCLVNLLAMTSRLERLENDMSHWGTLAELKNKQLEIQIQLEVMRRVWEYEYGRKIPDGTSKAPPDSPKPAPVLPPPLPIDPSQFRAEQQQKYPPKK
jgi:hypothetical protein